MKLGRFELNDVYLEDSYKAIKELPDHSIDLIYTDVPYLYNQGGGGKSEIGKASAKKRMTLMGCENAYINSLLDNSKTRTEALRIAKNKATNSKDIVDMESGFDMSILDEFVRIMKKINIYIWCSKLQILPLMKYFVDGHDYIFEILTWHKTNPMPTHNNCYPPDTEYCLLFREKGTGMGGTMATLKKYYISPINVADKNDYEHPTIKPLQFVKNHIYNSANGKKDFIVFDAFAGSSTTLCAAKELGLNYLGFEINEKYYKISKDRLNGINQKGEMNLFTTDFDKEQERYEQMNLFEEGKNQ